VDAAVARLRACKLEKFTQTRTTIAQNQVLRSLDPDTLAELSLRMEAEGMLDAEKVAAK
jgi:hypothetical protein